MAENTKTSTWVGGMGPGRSENPKKSAEVCAVFSTLPHPEGWATDPSRFAKAGARRGRRHVHVSFYVVLSPYFPCYSIWFSDCPSCGSPNVHPFSSPSVPPPMVSYGILFPECPSSSSPNVPYSAFTLVFSGFPECPQCTLWAPPGGSPGAFRGLFGSSWGHRSPKWLQDCFPMPL